MLREADRWLTVRTNDGSRPIRWDELEEFEFDGRLFTLRDRQRGIRKPHELDAALSITTRYTPPGTAARYDDRIGLDGLIRYKYRDDRLGWFFGVGESYYKPVYPVFIVAEEPAHIIPGSRRLTTIKAEGSSAEIN